MNRITMLVAGLGIAGAALPATASAATYGSVNRQQANIQQRISYNAHRGMLTTREARNLRLQLKQIERLEYRYRISGHRLTGGELRDLNRRLDRLSQQVNRQSHDRQVKARYDRGHDHDRGHQYRR
ncbi:hypothetical protein GCM10023219_29600 [Stakelama sediminis]|uniref:Uncharacterized protein n=1 Tax=Stakelama sediminis TaxID=463200 RepID=A0A840Z312_9SPHN|nr:hypothetical protein [Stakelama sediminis]MBB5720273.1 hypothetical protein [Stakelama sediminis]